MSDFNLDLIIETCRKGEQLTENVFVELMLRLMEVIAGESNLLELQSPIIICGDIHGQLYDLFQLFDAAGKPEDNKFLFMGDYVDRGYYSILTFSYLESRASPVLRRRSSSANATPPISSNPAVLNWGASGPSPWSTPNPLPTSQPKSPCRTDIRHVLQAGSWPPSPPSGTMQG